jgi:hypothetical protein
MKFTLLAVAALLFAAPAAAPVRYEANGLRVGDELVSGAALQLKSVDASTLLVSASAVENLGAALDIALDATHAMSLQPGLRLERRAADFLLASHGPALAVDGLSLNGATSIAFTLTAKGFDFGALGTVEGSSFTARVAQGQDGVISPERRALQGRLNRANVRHNVFRGGNPFVPNAGADREVFSNLAPISPDGT